MKVLWISDFGINHNIGGAQRSDAILHERANSLGYDLNCLHFDGDISLLNLNYDVVVSSNLEVLSRQWPNLISWIASQRCHVRVEHDANRYLSVNARRQLFGSCKGTVFLTNFHYQQFINSYGDIFQNVFIIPDPIDTDLFRNLKLERSDNCIYTGFMHELKGTKTFIEYALDNPHMKFSVAAWGDKTFEFVMKKLDNVQFYGSIPFKQMPQLYNEHASMFYQPQFYEPFCRSVGEALLCGMKILGNDKIGCVHQVGEIGMEKFREDCSKAPDTFWDMVNELL